MLLWLGLDHAEVANAALAQDKSARTRSAKACAALAQLVERGAYRYFYTEAKRQSRGIETRKQYYFEASEKS